MYDIILDTLMDGIRLLPFLFVTYIVMEYIEHKMSAGTRRVVQASGRFGPRKYSRHFSPVRFFGGGGQFVCGAGHYPRYIDRHFSFHIG